MDMDDQREDAEIPEEARLPPAELSAEAIWGPSRVERPKPAVDRSLQGIWGAPLEPQDRPPDADAGGPGPDGAAPPASSDADRERLHGAWAAGPPRRPRRFARLRRRR